MTIRKITIGEHDQKLPMLKELKEGTLVTGISSNPGCIYIKMKKKGLGAGVTLNWPSGHSLLFNPLYGTVRAVSAEVRVQPLIVDNMEAYVPEIDEMRNRGMFRLDTCQE